MKISIEVVKDMTQKIQADAVIVIAFSGDQFATTSYGRDRATCRSFAKVCDQIHDEISDGTIPIPE